MRHVEFKNTRPSDSLPRVYTIVTPYEQYIISQLNPSQPHVRTLQRDSKAVRGNTC